MLARSHALALFFFFFNDTATTEIYTLSLHDALPISSPDDRLRCREAQMDGYVVKPLRREDLLDTVARAIAAAPRSEEHTSELQSRLHLVCRLLLEKKKEHPADASAPSGSGDRIADAR